MKQRRKSVYLSALVALLWAVLLFSCEKIDIYKPETMGGTEATVTAAKTDAPDTSVASDSSAPITEQTEPVITDAPPKEDVLAITVYPDRYSEEYRSLGDDIEQIDTGFTGNVKTVRLRAETDGIRVTLERVEYTALFDFYRVTDQIVSFDAERGKVYELACPTPGKTPEFRLAAEMDDCRDEYFIRKDTDSKAVALVCGEWEPRDITLISPEMAIARSMAIAHAKYGDISDDAVCREVIASAIAQHRSYEYTEKTEFFETEQWLILAYLHAAYPDRDTLPPQDGELIAYPETGGIYRTAPLYYSGKAAASVFDISENADGTVTVRYDVIVYSEDAPPELTGRAVTLTPYRDGSSPFDYAVTAVCEAEIAY